MAIVSLVAFILGKISLLKQEKQFWKDSCFVAMEMYNNKLVKESMNTALKRIANEDHIN